MEDFKKKIEEAAKKYAIRDGYHDELYKDEKAFEAGAKSPEAKAFWQQEMIHIRDGMNKEYWELYWKTYREEYFRQKKEESNYTHDEVFKLLFDFGNHMMISNEINVDEWFEENKKKI